MSQQNVPLVLNAISFAAREHQGQFRKDGKTPYIAHPTRVLTVMTSVFGMEDGEVLAAAALHDTIEDTTADRDDIIEHFGERIAEYVALLSKDKRLTEAERERTYFETLNTAPIEVKLIKLADTYDNLVDSAGSSDPARRKTIGKAEEILELFAAGFPEQWQHVLEQVRDQVRIAKTVKQ